MIPGHALVAALSVVQPAALTIIEPPRPLNMDISAALKEEPTPPPKVIKIKVAAVPEWLRKACLMNGKQGGLDPKEKFVSVCGKQALKQYVLDTGDSAKKARRVRTASLEPVGREVIKCDRYGCSDAPKSGSSAGSGYQIEIDGRELATTLAVQGSYFFGGPIVGTAVCTAMRYGQLVDDSMKAGERWTQSDYQANFGLTAFRCSPLGFIDRLQYARNPIEGMAILLGGVSGFVPMPDIISIPATIGAQVLPQLPDPFAHKKKRSAHRER